MTVKTAYYIIIIIIIIIIILSKIGFIWRM